MKKIKCVVLFLILSLMVCGCSYKYGMTTRTIRHAGYTVSSSEFVCPSLIEKNQIKDKVRFFTGSNIITESGKIYQISLANKFSNDTNCKESELEEDIEAIFDSNVGRSIDGVLYYLENAENQEAYTQVEATDEKYPLYNLLLQDTDIRKVISVSDKDNVSEFYCLKTDGEVYNYRVRSIDKRYYIENISLVTENMNFESKVIDFNYVGDNVATYYRTQSSYYKTKVTNLKKCSKYVDVNCKYKLKFNEELTKESSSIFAYNGFYLITTYGKIFSVSN